MRYTKVLSGLFLTGLLAAFANAQDKPKPVEKPLEALRLQAAGQFLAEVTKPEPTIATIIANHPDVKLAEAKLQVARAELEQARLLITQKYTVAKAKLDAAQTQLKFAEIAYAQIRSITGVARPEVQSAELALAQAKSAVVIAEVDLKAIQGSVSSADQLLSELLIDRNAYYTETATKLYSKALRIQPKPTTQSAKLREVLERKVALDLSKPLPLDELMAIFLPKSGLDAFLVRYPEWASTRFLKEPHLIKLPKSEQTTFAWLQLIQDEFNSRHSQNMPELYQGKYEVYVRDYGLMFAKSTLAPEGAMKLEEFMRLPPVVETLKETPKK